MAKITKIAAEAAESDAIRKIRKAGLRVIPKNPVVETAVDEDAASAAPSVKHRKLVIKKVSAAPTKFAPKKAVAKNAAEENIVENEAPVAAASATSSKLRTKKEVDAARANALDSKMVTANKNDTMKVYMGEIAQIPLVNKKEEAELAEAIHSSDQERYEDARTTLIKANLRLVVKIAHDFRGCGLPISDLISEGNIGLIRAGRSFDPQLGAKFSSYAAWWIKQTMRRAIANQTHTIRVPVQTGSKMNRIRQTGIMLKAELGREPSDLEIAEYLDFSERTVSNLRRAETSIISLQDQIVPGENSSFEELIPDPKAVMPGTGMCNNDSMDLLEECVSQLEPREREIIFMRFFENKTLDDVSLKIGRTRERVRQIQNQALSKLRSRMKEEAGVVA